MQSHSWTKKKIAPFFKRFEVNVEEFEKSLDQFVSFNDFFCRKLKSSARPICPDEKVAIAPADGRYLVFPQVGSQKFSVKGKSFSLATLLGDPLLTEQYGEGSMALIRLCPYDYHRFHFPCHAIPSPASLIKGPLFSVNPLALRRNINILAENKRTLTHLSATPFGSLLYIEVGALCVGSITQTYTPGKPVSKGEEKGFFSFGASTIILLFKKGTIAFDEDLIAASSECIETFCRMGQSLGRTLG
jgi:phosphatidylserine decarboxylase